MTTVLFLIVLALLVAEGFVLAGCVLGRQCAASLRLALALPLAALSNVLLTWLCTITTLPLNPWTLLGGHILITGISFFMQRQLLQVDQTPPPPLPVPLPLALRTLCLVILAASFLYAFAHAVLLPSFQVDSFSNWTMRAKISFIDQEIAFDRTETRGIAKPQYPFLVHSLQITANQLQLSWSDRIANGITFLLTLSSFVALFLLLRRLRGTDTALLGTALVLGLPLLSVHLSQGYGDIHLISYLLLSLLSLFLWQRTSHARWLLLSSLFIAASVWTKSEGWIAGLLPWMLVSGLLLWKKKRAASLAPKNGRASLILALALALSLSALFPALLFVEGLGLTPHGSDFALGFYPAAGAELIPAIFVRGSLGLTWYLLPPILAMTIWKGLRRDPCIDRMYGSGLVWGAIALLIVLVTYTVTPNAQFLLNGESFYRQMLIPSTILILTCILMWTVPRSAHGIHTPA